MKSLARCAVTIALATSCLFGLGSIAEAAPSGGGGSSATDMDKLKSAGYTCERIGIAGHICTKKGQRDQYCDNAGTCESVRITVRPGQPTAPPPPPIKGTSGR